MNIAVSFCGEGLGHASRMSAVASELRKFHNLFFWCPDQVKPFFKSTYNDAKLYTVPLLSLIKKNNKLQASSTVKINFKTLFFNKNIVNKLAKQLLFLKIDAVISDYEPFLVKAAKQVGIPVLLFNHPGIIKKFAKISLSYFFSRVTAHFMMPYAQKNKLIISSFYHGDIGPILRKEIKTAIIKKDDFILVYLKTSLAEKLLPILQDLKEINFRFFPNEEYDFISSLASCKAVVAPAGHQLISECLYLKKPILVIPEVGQYEQLLNAEMVVKTGYGNIIDENNMKESIINFTDKVSENFFKNNGHLTNFIFTDDLENAVNKINTFLQNCNFKMNKTKQTNILGLSLKQ